LKIAEAGSEIHAARIATGDINWGRARADTLLNPDTSKTTNKFQMRLAFKEHEVPTPELVSYETAKRLTATGRVFVGRPTRHTRKRGFWLCKTPADVERAWRGTRTKKAATHFMAYVPHDHEFRIHVFLGKSIRISEKQFSEGNKYTTIKPTCDKDTRKLLRQAAKRAVESVGLDFGCVDLLLGRDGKPYVLEVNSAPGVGGTLPKLYAETFEAWSRGDWDE
jgi:hypothetical protein